MKKFLLFLPVILLLFSCSKEPEEEAPSVPAWKEYLVYAASRDMRIESISSSGDTTKIEFENLSVLAISKKELLITEYPESGMPSLEVVGGVWHIGGKDTGTVVRPELSKVFSEIVFAGYDNLKLLLAFSNGEKLEIGIVQPAPKEIPVIRITTDGQKPVTSKEDYVAGTIVIEDPSHLYMDEDKISMRMKIRGRGNSSWNRPKKPYKIKLDEGAKLFGFHKDKEWCLLAEYYDRSLIRNEVAMEVSRICGFSWTPGMVKVELWLNGKYEGVYTFCEHKKVDKHRVNIQPTDSYLAIDEVQDKPYHFKTSMNIPVMFDEPETPDYSQYRAIVDYFKSFEAALQGSDFKDPVKGYAAYIDVPSWVNYYILQELLKNIDGNTRRSTFITKEEGKKLEMYHVWDFDLAIGNCDYFDKEFPGSGNDYTGFYIRDYNQYYTKNTGWYYRLFQDPAFVAAVKSRWNELKPQFETIPSYIDNRAYLMGDAVSRNFDRWKILGESLVCPVKNLNTYQEHVSYLKKFYIQRLEWLDREINALQ